MQVIQRTVAVAALAICLPCSSTVLQVDSAAPPLTVTNVATVETRVSSASVYVPLPYDLPQSDTVNISEPGSLALMGLAILGVAAAMRYRRKAKTTSQRQSR